MKAKVKWFNAAKGYGFAVLEDGREIFLHFTNLVGEKTLATNQIIMVDLYESPKGLEGKNIRV